MISSKKYVDETLRNNNLTANKALGQNFLIDEDIAKEIVLKANINKDSYVIEIGPGLGALSEIIATKTNCFKMYEIDKNMVNILNETFKEYKNVSITNIDFLKVDIEKLIADANNQGYNDIIIISNLPYYITSKLLNKILINNLKINTFIAMMQKEVGQKIIKPDKKDLNPLSIILKYQYDVEIIKYVSKNSYLPRPNIDSIVLKFSKTAPKYNCSFNSLVSLLDIIFKNRRKTIYNNLKPIFKNNDDLLNCLNKVNIDPTLRVEQLNMDDIVSLANEIF